MRLETVGLVVRDLAESLRFYRTLGVPIPAGLEHGGPHAEYTPAEGAGLGFASEAMVREIDPSFAHAGPQHRVSVQFRCATPGEVDAAYDRVIAAGYAGYKEPWDAPWGQRFARVVDPDGNVVGLFCELA